MIHLRRTTALILVALIVVASAPQGVFAQDAVTFDGSALVARALEAARTDYLASQPEAKIEIASPASGTTGGFDKFCAGSLDVAMAYGPITDAQAALCAEKKVEYVEVLLGYDVAVVAVNQASPATCLSVEQLNTLFSPSATGVNNWQTVDSTLGDKAIPALYAPPDDAQSRFLFDRIIAGDGLRSDLTVLTTAAEMSEKLGAEPDSVALMTLAEFSGISGTAIKTLQVRSGTACLAANAVNLDEARYPAAETLYLYVNAQRLENTTLKDFLTYLLGSKGQSKVRAGGFTTAGAVIYERGLGYLAEKRAGRTFSRIQRLNIAADVAGVLNLNGAAAAYGLMGDLNTGFTPRFANVVVTSKLFGTAPAYASLCSDSADAILVTRGPNEQETASCQSSGIQTLRLNLGASALVVVINLKNEFGACLTYDALGKIFGAGKAAGKWSEVAEGYPDTELTVLLPVNGGVEADELLTRITSDQVAPLARTDAIEKDDALYRAAAVQNVEGAVTLMTYADFRKSTSNVRLAGIDVNGACVTPDDKTIADGSYPLSTSYSLVVNTRSFARPEVRAYTWYLLSDDALTVLSRRGLIAVDTTGIVGARESVLDLFAKAEAASAAPTPEATAPATPEVAATPGN